MRLGAKYKAKRIPDSKIFECVFVSPGNEENRGRTAVFRFVDHNHLVWDYTLFKEEWNSYEEYVEPRREFFNAFKMGVATEFTGPYKSRIGSDQFTVSSGYFRYGILELIHHSETKVESIFHLVKK